jgi:hypothetical protein
MAYPRVREKQAVVIVELLETATQRLRTAHSSSPRLRRASSTPPLPVAQRAMLRQEHWAESVAPCLAVEKRQGPPALRPALFAPLE